MTERRKIWIEFITMKCKCRRILTNPRYQVAFWAFLGIFVTSVSITYSIFHSWPKVHCRTDVGSLLTFDYLTRSIYNDTGCGDKEASMVDPFYNKTYDSFRLQAVYVCHELFKSAILGYVAMAVMIFYFLASFCLLLSTCTYNPWLCYPWFFLHGLFTVVSIVGGILFLIAFEPRLVLNMDESSSAEEWETTLGKIVLDTICVILATVLKVAPLYSAYSYLYLIKN